MDYKKGVVKIMLIGFAIGLFVGLFGGVVFTSLATMSKISGLHEEIRVLNEMDSNDSNENRSISKYEEALNELTEDEMITLNEMVEGKD